MKTLANKILKRYRKGSCELNTDTTSYVEFNFGYSLGYGSVEYNQQVEADYDKYLSSSRWDSFYWDSFFWDSSGFAPQEIQMSGTSENVAIAISGSVDYVLPFTINSFIIHYSIRRLMR